MRFNPRAREGRDIIITKNCQSFCEFQSTRPRGARPDLLRLLVVVNRFNPRAREGRDIFCGIIREREIDVSIHAPARGATIQRVLNTGEKQSFNPRAREGRDYI